MPGSDRPDRAKAEGLSDVRRAARWPSTQQPWGVPARLHAPVGVSLALACPLGALVFLLSLSLVTLQLQFGQAVSTHGPPVAGDQGFPDAFSAFLCPCDSKKLGVPGV